MGREDDERRETRREIHRRRLGVRCPRCSACGEFEPAAITGQHFDIVCYACSAETAGRTIVERHHYAGWRSDRLKVPLPANWHRMVSDDAYLWDEETRRNPRGSPLRAGAAALRGRLAVDRIMTERIESWLPAYLERLDTHLTELHGESWWEAVGIERPPFMP